MLELEDYSRLSSQKPSFCWKKLLLETSMVYLYKTTGLINGEAKQERFWFSDYLSSIKATEANLKLRGECFLWTLWSPLPTFPPIPCAYPSSHSYLTPHQYYFSLQTKTTDCLKGFTCRFPCDLNTLPVFLGVAYVVGHVMMNFLHLVAPWQPSRSAGVRECLHSARYIQQRSCLQGHSLSAAVRNCPHKISNSWWRRVRFRSLWQSHMQSQRAFLVEWLLI